jgi:cell division protein FtsB
MKWLIVALVVALLLLQYRMFMSNDGVREVLRLQSAVVNQQAENARLSERNAQLAAEVHDLKQGYAALEERARSELGMIAGNESFYQVVPQKPAAPIVAPLPVPALRSQQRTAQLQTELAR